MAKAKFKVYSKRVDEFTNQLSYGMSLVRAGEGETSDFGTKNPWGEVQINCDQDIDASSEFEIGDLVEVQFNNLGKEEESTDSAQASTPAQAPGQVEPPVDDTNDGKPARRPIVDEDDDDEDDDKPAKAAKTTTRKS